MGSTPSSKGTSTNPETKVGASHFIALKRMAAMTPRDCGVAYQAVPEPHWTRRLPRLVCRGTGVLRSWQSGAGFPGVRVGRIGLVHVQLLGLESRGSDLQLLQLVSETGREVQELIQGSDLGLRGVSDLPEVGDRRHHAGQ